MRYEVQLRQSNRLSRVDTAKSQFPRCLSINGSLEKTQREKEQEQKTAESCTSQNCILSKFQFGHPIYHDCTLKRLAF